MKKPAAEQANYDVGLLFSVLLLVGIGIVMVYSASSTLALEKYGEDYYFLKKQVLFALLGVAALIAGRHVPFRLYRPLTYVFLGIAFALLIAIQVTSLGHTAGGAERWLRYKWFSFQPSEFARFALITYLAYSMSKKQDKIKELSIGFIPHIVVLSLFILLISMQPDFGSIIIFCTLTWIMLFVGGVRIRYLLFGVLAVIPFLAYFMYKAAYPVKRIIGFLDPWQYPADIGYHIIHSLMAFGTGGLWGMGIGQGYQKLFYLPEPHTDFIFSVIGEELGLLGVMAIIGLYAVILFRGVTISRNSEDLFGSFLALGLTIALGIQVCINMGVALGLLPPKGLTLPFLSYGGTSLLLNMACIGILMNIGASQTK